MKPAIQNKLKWTGLLFMGGAACISLYLACSGMGRTPLAGCEAGTPCGKALQTPWAFVFGLPVSFPGFLLYSYAILMSGAYVRRERSAAGLQGMAALAAVVAGAIWFSCLQIVAMSSFCLWCALVHGFAGAGAAFLCAARMKNAAPAADRTAGAAEISRLQNHQALNRILATSAAAVCVGVLATGALSHASQHPAPENSDAVEYLTAETEAPQEGSLALHNGKYRMEPVDFPVIGRDAPEAPMAVLLSDYTSDQCRKYLAAVQSSLPTAEKPVRLVILPAALTPETESIQRVMMALYLTDRIAWRSVSALITSGQIPAESGAVERVARKLAGAEKWASALETHAYKIEQQTKLAAALLEESRRDGKSGGLPLVICGTRTLAPGGPDMKELMTFLTNGAAPAKPAEAASDAKGNQSASAFASKPLSKSTS